jgi:hypothetical protein
VESKLGPLGTSATPGLPAPGDCEDGKISGMKIGQETEALGENLPQRHFVHHKSHLTRPGREPVEDFTLCVIVAVIFWSAVMVSVR